MKLFSNLTNTATVTVSEIAMLIHPYLGHTVVLKHYLSSNMQYAKNSVTLKNINFDNPFQEFQF